MAVLFSTAQTVPVIGLNDLESRLEKGADTTFVVNFLGHVVRAMC